MSFNVIVLLIFFIKYSESYYNETNSVDLFNMFKKRYDRHYSTAEMEQKAYKNFIFNLNYVTSRNAKSHPKFKLLGLRQYNLNKYADQNPNELYHQYALTMRPFYKSNDLESYDKNYAHSLTQKDIEDLNLYDLDETEDLYEKFKKTYNKTYTHFTARQISYYRFYKTLVELNNKKINGEDVKLDRDADEVRHPHEYYFDE